jgi:hypothetical protein
MDITHEELYKKIPLISEIAQEAINFFNRDLPKEKKRGGIRICFSAVDTGEDVLHLTFGTFPIEKSEKYFNFSRAKSKVVCNHGPLTSDKYEVEKLPKGGVQGFHYGIGSSGQEPEDDETTSFTIIMIIEPLLPLMVGREFSEEHMRMMTNALAGTQTRINDFLNYLSKETTIFSYLLS